MTKKLVPLVFLSLPCMAWVDALAIRMGLPSSRCSTLQKSLEKCGAKIDGVTIKRYSESERTMVTTKDVPAGHVLMRLPIELGVTPSRAATEYEAAADARLAKEALGTSDSDLLAIWLLSKTAEEVDRKVEDEEDPYLASLPTPAELSHMPVYWDDSDVSWLKGSEAGVQLTSRKEREADFFGRMSKSSPAFARIAPTFDSWIWAKSNVQSRAFSISNPLLDTPAAGTCIGEHEEEDESTEPNNGKSNENFSAKVPALFPLADMVNHVTTADGCTCEWGIERNSGDFLLRTVRDVSADAELSVSYGSVSSSSCLLNYGFVYESPTAGVQENEKEVSSLDETRPLDDDGDDAECATIKLSLDIIENFGAMFREETDTNEEVLRDLKEQVWARDEGCYSDFDWGPKERVVLLQKGTVESGITVMSLLRVGVATMEEMEQLFENDCDEDGEERGSIAAMLARNPFRWRNELAALRVFEEVINDQLKAFPDMYGKSGKTRGESLNFNAMNAVKAVEAEKDVLDHWRRLVKMAGNVLESRRDCFDFGLHYPKLFKSLLSVKEQIKVNDEE